MGVHEAGQDDGMKHLVRRLIGGTAGGRLDHLIHELRLARMRLHCQPHRVGDRRPPPSGLLQELVVIVPELDEIVLAGALGGDRGALGFDRGVDPGLYPPLRLDAGLQARLGPLEAAVEGALLLAQLFR